MALSANTVWEIRTTGSDTNGGGFVTGASGTDWSQQNSAQYSVTDGVTAGTTTITSATANFGTDVVGNIMYVVGGTGSVTASRYQITARTNSTTITVDRNTGLTAGTGVTLVIGGAMASPGAVAPLIVAGNTVHQKAGTYLITSASTNISGGCVTINNRYQWYGYQTTRGDLGTPPVLQASGISTAVIFSAQGSGQATLVQNIEIDGAGLTSIRGFAGSPWIDLCIARNCTNIGFAVSSAVVTRCLATGCSTQAAYGSSSTTYYACVADGNSATGWSDFAYIDHCISINNTGASSDGFVFSNRKSANACIAYNNGRDGFRFGAAVSCLASNCIAEDNAGWGFNTTNAAATSNNGLMNCAGYSNTSGEQQNFIVNTNFKTGSSSFFNNAAGDDFGLNSTSGAGALLRGAGMPGAYMGLPSTVGYPDIGALQHQDSGGSASYSGFFLQ